MSELGPKDHKHTTDATRAVIAAAYKAARASDFDAIIALLHPDIVLQEPASLPIGGVHRGLEDVLKALGYVFETFDMSQLTVDEVIADGERAVGLANLVSRDDGSVCPIAELWRVRDGRITEVRPYYFDTAAIVGVTP